MNDDDDEDLPQFPWPMWFPAVQWIVHGLAILGGCIYVFANGDTHDGYCISTFAVPVAITFLSSGIGILFSRSIFLMGSLTFTVILAMILLPSTVGVAYPYKLFIIIEDITLWIMTAIAMFYFPVWDQWVEERERREMRD